MDADFHWKNEASSCWPKICIFKLQPLSPPLIERAENFLYNLYVGDLERAIVALSSLLRFWRKSEESWERERKEKDNFAV